MGNCCGTKKSKKKKKPAKELSESEITELAISERKSISVPSKVKGGSVDRQPSDIETEDTETLAFYDGDENRYTWDDENHQGFTRTADEQHFTQDEENPKMYFNDDDPNVSIEIQGTGEQTTVTQYSGMKKGRSKAPATQTTTTVEANLPAELPDSRKQYGAGSKQTEQNEKTEGIVTTREKTELAVDPRQNVTQSPDYRSEDYGGNGAAAAAEELVEKGGAADEYGGAEGGGDEYQDAGGTGNKDGQKDNKMKRSKKEKKLKTKKSTRKTPKQTKQSKKTAKSSKKTAGHGKKTAERSKTFAKRVIQGCKRPPRAPKRVGGRRPLTARTPRGVVPGRGGARGRGPRRRRAALTGLGRRGGPKLSGGRRRPMRRFRKK